MSIFKIGQKVVCIKNSQNINIKNGSIYSITNIMYCSMCGVQCINVDNIKSSISNKTKCNCKNTLESNGLKFNHNNFFRPLDHTFADKIEAMIKKSLVTACLLFALTASSQDTICLTKPEYENVYNGLRQRDFYKQRSAEYLTAVHNLNNIIISNNDSLQTSLQVIKSLNQELYVKQDELLKLTKETPWYSKWYLWFGVGCVTGLILGGN